MIGLTYKLLDFSQIWYNKKFDSATNGVFDTSYVQDTLGNHVESIYFPLSGTAPAGKYRITVSSYDQINTADNWKVEVFTNGGVTPILVQTGTGTRENIIYQLGDGTQPAACVLSDPLVQCCQDLDCSSSGAFERQCVNRLCVTKGNPRMTLSYFGSK